MSTVLSAAHDSTVQGICLICDILAYTVQQYSMCVTNCCSSDCVIMRAIAVNGAFRIGICCAGGYGCSQGTLCV